MGLRNLSAVNGEWSFAAAQAAPGTLILTVASNQHVEVYYAKAKANNANTGDVSVRIGASSTGGLPTLTDNTATPVTGMVLSDAGLAKGGGEVSAMGGAPVLVGGPGASLYIICSASVQLRIIMQYRIISDDGA